MKDDKEIHEVESVALAYIRCSCGWEYRKQSSLKGKTDEELALETGLIFTEHKRLKDK